MPYASIQAIREGAGLLYRAVNEKAIGAVDGSNQVYTTKRRPIVDGNYDDEVGPEDVHVYVNGTAVAVGEVVAEEGKITLAAAPAVNDKVTIDYCHSPVTDEYVEGKQTESDNWIDMKIKGSVSVPLKEPIPGVIVTAAEMYAAGLILTRDWGNRVDSELSSKDGFAKIRQARELVADYLQGVKDDKERQNNGSGGYGVSVGGVQDVFGNCYDEDRPEVGGPTDDEFFMRRH